MTRTCAPVPDHVLEGEISPVVLTGSKAVGPRKHKFTISHLDLLQRHNRYSQPQRQLTCLVLSRAIWHSNAFEMAGTLTRAALRFFALHVLATLLRITVARRAVLQGASAPAAGVASVTEYTWHVTLSSQAPDCFQRNVILVNGSFQPTLEVVQGDFLKVCCKLVEVAPDTCLSTWCVYHASAQLVKPLSPAQH